MKNFLKELLAASALIVAFTLVLFPPQLSSDEVKIILGLPSVIILSFYGGVYITKRERYKREFEKKKALRSGNYSKAYRK
ncbi:hypothetical protein QTL86_03300 [Cellulosilyticum sp. ST5]|uniref:hypothetical protein n=1 Tax=Cellulosilyticum sp. ST5 TaxID=3055805 RepID=UPI003977BE19